MPPASGYRFQNNSFNIQHYPTNNKWHYYTWVHCWQTEAAGNAELIFSYGLLQSILKQEVSTSIHNISQSTCLSEYGCADAFYWGSYIWKYYWERLCQYSCHYISALRTCVANGAPMHACDSFSFAFVVLHVFLFRSGYELLLKRSEEDFFVGTIRLS